MASTLDTSSWQSETLTRALVAREDCDILAELIVIRDQANQSDRVDHHFANKRDEARKKDPVDRSRSYAVGYARAIDDMNRKIGMPRTSNFLDLGCAPGAFTQHFFLRNPQARGIGITLPEEISGNVFTMSNPEYLNRYDLQLVDLTAFDLAPDRPKAALTSPIQKLVPLPFEPASQDLIICDAQWVFNPDNVLRPWNWTRLIISQFLIALRAVSPGGSILMRLSCVERTLTGRILLALCRVSELVRTVKSTQFYSVRSSFYVLAQRIDPSSEEFQSLVAALQSLWYIMTFEGEEGHGRDIDDKDEQLITNDEELLGEQGLSVLVQLGTPVWNVQYDALSSFLNMRGV